MPEPDLETLVYCAQDRCVDALMELLEEFAPWRDHPAMQEGQEALQEFCRAEEKWMIQMQEEEERKIVEGKE